MKRGRTVVVVAALLLSVVVGCRRVELYQGDSLTVAMSQADATRIITRALEEQPTDEPVVNIEVSATKLRFATQEGGFLNVAPRLVPTTFFFDSLGKMDSAHKKHGEVVRVWDSSGVFRFDVVISDPARAKQFMDAMASMAQAKR